MKQKSHQIRKETIPNQSLYRFIDDAYCEQFVKEGKIRFGNIQKYAVESKDVRDDATESVATYINEFGGTSSSSVMNEAVYILSCSRATTNFDIKKLAQKFNENGNLYLEIFNPNLFLQKIKAVDFKKISKFIKMYSDDVYWVDVAYSKGSLENRDEIEYRNIHIFQKPREEISPQVVSSVNGIVMDRRPGGVAMHFGGGDVFDSHWPQGRSPINYEEEQECRLVLDGTHSIVVEHAGLIFSLDEIEYLNSSHQPMLLPENLKPKTVDINCGNLEDCVRIRDIRDIQ